MQHACFSCHCVDARLHGQYQKGWIGEQCMQRASEANIGAMQEHLDGCIQVNMRVHTAACREL